MNETDFTAIWVFKAGHPLTIDVRVGIREIFHGKDLPGNVYVFRGGVGLSDKKGKMDAVALDGTVYRNLDFKKMIRVENFQ